MRGYFHGRILAESGFTELRPPSNLVMPGSIVLISSRNPLRVSTVCGSEGAFGINPSSLAQSASADVKTSKTFEGTYKANLAWIGSLAGTGSKVQNADLLLSNVKIIELTDENVIEDLPNRSEPCKEALAFRYKSEPDNLTIVDSVLLADAEYRIEFKDKTTAEESAYNVANSAGLTVQASRDGNSVLVGKGLVWGIRDDQRKVILGLGLPSTSATGTERRSVLRKGVPVEGIDNSKQARLSNTLFRQTVRVDVVPIRQPTNNGCWATVYAMLYNWKHRSNLSITEAIQSVGKKYREYFDRDTGLPFGGEQEFVDKAGLIAEPPMNYTLNAYRDSAIY